MKLKEFLEEVERYVTHTKDRYAPEGYNELPPSVNYCHSSLWKLGNEILKTAKEIKDESRTDV